MSSVFADPLNMDTLELGRKINLVANGGQNGSVYEWRLGTELLPESGPVLQIELSKLGVLQVSVQERNSNSCEGEISMFSMLIKAPEKIEKTEVKIYTLITPNGDGHNDFWQIDSAEILTNSEIKVFNANGQTVFSEIGYQEAWDGKYQGKELPSGEYYYTIKNETQLLKGIVVILNQ